MKFRKTFLPALGVLCLFQISQSAMAEALDPTAENVGKLQVTDSMIGKRSTLRFYIFEDKKAILWIQIGNENAKFPIAAKLYEFPDNTTPEGLKKWVNNQHSDGLFPDVPEPEKTHEIPAKASSVTAKEAGEQTKTPNGEFTRYDITFEFKDVPKMGDLEIKDFTDKAAVFVKTQAG